jgi:hypothetical protein
MENFRCWLLAAIAVPCLLIAPALAPAQGVPVGWVQVTASNTMDAGVLIAHGTVSFTPVSNGGQPLSFRVGSSVGGQAGPDPWTAPVTAGAFSILVPDSVMAFPTNVCYSVTITDNASGDVLSGPGYMCVQPADTGGAVSGSQAWCTPGGGGSGAACDWDAYPPNEAALAVTQPGPTGPPGPATILLSINGTLVGVATVANLTMNGSAL